VQTFVVPESTGFRLSGDFSYEMFQKPAGGAGAVFAVTNHSFNGGTARSDSSWERSAAPRCSPVTDTNGQLIWGNGSSVIDDNAWHYVHVTSIAPTH
jgi:hypothetical protein